MYRYKILFSTNVFRDLYHSPNSSLLLSKYQYLCIYIALFICFCASIYQKKKPYQFVYGDIFQFVKMFLIYHIAQ
jgi:hypothetical protein